MFIITEQAYEATNSKATLQAESHSPGQEIPRLV
jgi:hypothetical protein